MDLIAQNKLRTFLTGFSVAWGIFMLVILLGAGNGLKNGVTYNFGDMAVNSMQLYGGWTSVPYAGYEKDRRITLSNRDIEILKDDFSEVAEVGARGRYSSKQMAYGKESASVQLLGMSVEMARMMGIEVTNGRFINEQDIKERRKVMVIDKTMREVLFKGEDPIGKLLSSQNGVFTVIGEYKSSGRGRDMRGCIPITTGQLLYEKNDVKVQSVMFTVDGVDNKEQAKVFEDNVRKRMSKEHRFEPTDRSAIWVQNNIEEYSNVMMIFNGITIFVWIIGIGTLMAGVVGVSIIMLVTVRERTNEFGIRKALGARPRSIIILILLESVMITALFGYLGMVSGVAVMEVVNYVLENAAATSADEFTTFKNPTLDLSITFSATVVLVVAGLIAGYVPARRAARLKTIDALRFNK